MTFFSNFIISSAIAQDASSQVEVPTPPEKKEAGKMGPENTLAQFAPLVLMFAVFYFLIIRPQAKKAKEEEKRVSELQKGEEVFTKAGMIGTITGLTDKVATLEIADGVKVKFLRAQLGGTTKELFAEKTAAKTPVVVK